jgi:transposase-like protein
MARKRYSAEQIIGLLRQADVELGKGRKAPEVCKALGIHKVTYYRWRREYGGRKVDQAKRMKELEAENARLKRIVAKQALDRAILKEAANPNL